MEILRYVSIFFYICIAAGFLFPPFINFVHEKYPKFSLKEWFKTMGRFMLFFFFFELGRWLIILAKSGGGGEKSYHTAVKIRVGFAPLGTFSIETLVFLIGVGNVIFGLVVTLLGLANCIFYLLDCVRLKK